MKKYRLLPVVILIISVAFIMGIDACQTTGSNYYYDKDGQYVEITNPPEQCVIYKLLGDTSVYKSSLFVLNYAAIKSGLYTSAQAVTELNAIEAEVIRPGASVGSFINTLIITAGKAAKVGAPELVTLTTTLEPYRGNMTPLDDCTKYKLLMHIGGQKNIAVAFAK